MSDISKACGKRLKKWWGDGVVGMMLRGEPR